MRFDTYERVYGKIKNVKNVIQQLNNRTQRTPDNAERQGHNVPHNCLVFYVCESLIKDNER